MSFQRVTMWNRFSMTVLLTVVALCTALAGEARATCFTNPAKSALAAPRVQFGAAAAAAALADSSSFDSIVGLWDAEFLLGTGPDLYDHSFQQFQSGGTEMMLSNGLPPALGNVCVGVWKQTGPRTVKLRHTAWNWDANGNLIGTFVMLVNLRLDRRGTTFGGTWTADNLDLQGNIDSHFEGTVRATRISVD